MYILLFKFDECKLSVGTFDDDNKKLTYVVTKCGRIYQNFDYFK